MMRSTPPIAISGSPKSAVEEYDHPALIAAAPIAAAIAFPALYAICIQAAPSISPPFEYPTIEDCNGLPEPKRAAVPSIINITAASL